FGRVENDSDQWGYFYFPTPLAPNLTKHTSQPFQGIIFSHEEGFYNQTIRLGLTSSNPEAIIKYTRDGSTPGMASLTYQTPIQLSSPTVIRAVEVVNGIIPDKGQARMFIVNHPQSGLPVISLTTDPVNLWDDTQGIYVTGTNGIRGNGPETDPPRNWNQDWERPTLMTYFDENGEIQVKQQVGIKIFGGWSRAFDQKSLSIYARKKYGKGSLDYRFFKEKNIESFESINLRNSGNDWSGADGIMMRDGVLQNIGIGRMNIDYQAYQPAEVYLNGEYWGIHNIREKLNEHYVADNHQENRDAIDLLEGYGTVNSGSSKDYFEMINWLENHHLSSAQNYQEAAEMIDIDHFIDYQIIQIYIDNRDWPGNNIKFWKPHRVGGKWRWILFDTDFGFGIWGQSPADNTIRFAREPNNTGWPNPSWSTFIFRKLLENNQFRLAFAQRFNYHLNTT
ncbi:MAG: CotH kinase family protein, partial [Bacteroidetes bacterium]|nr:CotH kinase family protein [Bacteroidota bacterium]